jgi:hypothetical protein
MIGMILLAATAFHGAGQMPVQTASRSANFCDVVKAPERFENRVIATKGILLPGEHSLGFYDPACKPTETNKISTQGVLDSAIGPKRLADKLRKLFRKQTPAEVEVEAVFHSEGGPFGADVARFRIVIQHLTSVQKLAKSFRKFSGQSPK